MKENGKNEQDGVLEKGRGTPSLVPLLSWVYAIDCEYSLIKERAKYTRYAKLGGRAARGENHEFGRSPRVACRPRLMRVLCALV